MVKNQGECQEYYSFFKENNSPDVQKSQTRLSRDQGGFQVTSSYIVYSITNVIKCVPPAGHEPSADEITACLPFLMRQIAIVQPRIICLMGDFAARSLLGTDKKILKLRGRFHNFHGTPVMPTFHPAFLIKYPDMKKGAWNDLQMIQRKLSHLQRMIP